MLTSKIMLLLLLFYHRKVCWPHNCCLSRNGSCFPFFSRSSLWAESSAPTAGNSLKFPKFVVVIVVLTLPTATSAVSQPENSVSACKQRKCLSPRLLPALLIPHALSLLWKMQWKVWLSLPIKARSAFSSPLPLSIIILPYLSWVRESREYVEMRETDDGPS